MDWKSRRISALLEARLWRTRPRRTLPPNSPSTPACAPPEPSSPGRGCIVAGIGCISAFLSLYGKLKPSGRFEVVSHPEIFDGVRVKKDQAIAVIRANAASILSTERVILNLMQRMSGIATLTNEYVSAVAAAKSKTKILDTRKTIPGLRALDKYAVSCGGGTNHRLDLQDGILIKNNHISLGGGLPTSLARALAGRKPGQLVQVEVRTQAELDQAITGGADSILLDNMKPKEVVKALKLIRKELPKATVEASGNITLKTVRAYAKTGVDFISVGALTHSATAVDLSMKITATLL